jgi:hypothetical protein
MKNFLTTILAIFIVSIPLFPQIGSDDFSGIFEIQGDYSFRVSIESYMERNGWIPVVLSFGDLEVCVPVNTRDLASPAGVEYGISKMLFGDSDFLFAIYEQNPVRTRMRLLEKSTPVILRINRGEKQVGFYMGNSRLRLEHVRVTFREIAPGWLYQLDFGGRDVYTYKRFIFEPDAGAIYAIPPHREPFNIDIYFDENAAGVVWARKIDIDLEDGRLIKEGGIK